MFLWEAWGRNAPKPPSCQHGPLSTLRIWWQLHTLAHFDPRSTLGWCQLGPIGSTWPNFGPMPPLDSANFAKFGPIPPSDSGNLARIVPTLPKLAQFHPWILTTLPNYTIEFVIEFVFKLSDSNFTSDPLNYQVHFTIRSTSLCACICTGAH